MLFYTYINRNRKNYRENVIYFENSIRPAYFSIVKRLGRSCKIEKRLYYILFF